MCFTDDIVSESDKSAHREAILWSAYDLELVKCYCINEASLKALETSGFTSFRILKSLPTIEVDELLKNTGLPLQQILEIYKLLTHYNPSDSYEAVGDLPMTDRHKDILQNNRDKLVGMIDADPLSDRLFAYHVFTANDVDKVKLEKTPQDKVREILSIIPRKADGAYALLMQALSDTEQGHVVKMLEDSRYQGISKGKKKCGIYLQ